MHDNYLLVYIYLKKFDPYFFFIVLVKNYTCFDCLKALHMLEGSVVIKLKQVVHGVPYTNLGLTPTCLMGGNGLIRAIGTPLGDCFLGNILQNIFGIFLGLNDINPSQVGHYFHINFWSNPLHDHNHRDIDLLQCYVSNPSPIMLVCANFIPPTLHLFTRTPLLSLGLCLPR
jgi:hypothetical protein